MTLARILAISTATLVVGVTLTLLSALPACSPALNSGADGPCNDDLFEPNDSLAEAADSEDLAVVLCPGNEDWWATQVESQFDFYFHASWDQSVGSLGLELFDAAGNTLSDFGSEWDKPGDLSMDISGPFEGAVRVARTDNGGTALPYTISVSSVFCCDE